MTTATAITAAPKRKGPPPAADRIAPIITAIAADVKIPETVAKARRGVKSQYPFHDLEVGQSFGVTNKSLKQMQSVVSAVNRKCMVEKRDANGNVVTKPITAKTPDGQTVTTAGMQPVMVPSKRFIVAEVDPKKDPAQAPVRVWRLPVED